MKGARKLVFGLVGLLFLLAGLVLCLRYPVAGAVLFPSFATAAVAVVSSVVLGNIGEHFATKGKPGGAP